MIFSFRYLMRCLTFSDSWKELDACDVLFISHENDKRFLFRGKFYAPIMDSVARYFNDVDTESLTKGIGCISKHKVYSGAKTYSRRWVLNKLASIILGNLSKDDTCYFRLQVKFWNQVLDKATPKAIIIVQADEALCFACYQRGIRIYDFQHGVITDSMPMYGRDFQQGKPKELLPTGYLCWDLDSCDVINRWSVDKGITAHHIGNPWLTRFFIKSNDDLLVNEEVNKITSLFDGNTSLNILVTLQWGLSSCYPNYFSGSECIHSELVKAIRKTKHVNWFVRLHPVQLNNEKVRDEIFSIFSDFENVEIERSTSMPFPLLLTLMDAHVTWDSSSVIEANYVKIPSFVLNPGYFSELQTPVKMRNEVKVKEPLPYSSLCYSNTVTRSKCSPDIEQILNWILRVSKSESTNYNGYLDEKLLRSIVLGRD
ncbi:hypothetical protein RJD40_00860 [Vibrio scophthalmi]|uniref:hypothetical protein n=1 Tax=Vibrio scophthalmi TaxID=45658 RepID=UPI003AAB4A79